MQTNTHLVKITKRKHLEAELPDAMQRSRKLGKRDRKQELRNKRLQQEI